MSVAVEKVRILARMTAVDSLLHDHGLTYFLTGLNAFSFTFAIETSRPDQMGEIIRKVYLGHPSVASVGISQEGRYVALTVELAPTPEPSEGTIEPHDQESEGGEESA